MEFKDRKSIYPGRIQLKDIYTNEIKYYEIIMMDDATEQGTPLNANLFEQLREDILNSLEGIQGEKGDKGDPALSSYITSISVARVD